MRLKTQRTAIYVAMGVAVLALSGGYALASFSLGNQDGVEQGSQATTVNEVTGLTYESMQLAMLSSPPANNTCSAAAPCSVTTTNQANCAGGLPGTTSCLAGDYVEEITLSTVADTAFDGTNGTVWVTIYVTALGTTYTGLTFTYTQASATNAAHTIVIEFDIGNTASGPADVTTASIIANAA